MTGKEVNKGDGSGFVKWFSELSNKDVAIAGGKGASLAEMYNNKFPIPPGFVVTADAYKYFIEKAGLQNQIMTILKETNIDDTSALNRASEKVKELVRNADMPSDLGDAILDAYDVLDVDKKHFSEASSGALDILRVGHEPPFVAVRSSATTEDLADASFAGQQETFLNVKGNDDLIESVKKAFASLFTARAIYYRSKKGFMHEQSYLAIVVQKMVNSEKSGVIFSKNPLKDDGNVVVEAVFGLGEGIVSGKISPDHYVVSKKFEIIERKISDKGIALTRSSSGKTETVKLTEEKSKQEVLTGHELKMLAQYALRLEEHYKKPQDIEFAIADNEIYITQSRPITTKAKKDEREIGGNVLISGLGASPGVASGVVKIVKDLSEMDKVQKGNVLVTKMTNPDMVVTMQRSIGIITDEGGITSHAAIVSREMGIPAVVGTKIATEKLKDGQVVTVDGYTGRIIEGKAEERKVEIKEIVPTERTKIKVIVDLPDYAKRAAESGAKSVGLVRLEASIALSGKHPVWFIRNSKMEEYIKNIYEDLKKISQPFDEVWVRTSDVRSDEYKNLEGAPQDMEGNPMLGNHGIRFGLRNQDLLESEFKAIKELADEYAHKKFGVMLPLLISVSELKEAKKIASEIGFPENVKFGVMIETPASVQIIEELCREGIDFASFGTNDLTQYTLAIDRNNENVQELYDEMNPAVLSSIAHVIEVCKRHNVETSICGQAGSRPEMAKFLVEKGINSISVNADAAYQVSKAISETEKSSGGVGPTGVPGQSGLKRKGEGGPGEERNEGIKLSVQTEPVGSSDSVNEEEIILRALGEDEYSPGIGRDKKRDIPPLNESMPVGPEDFESDEDRDDRVIEVMNGGVSHPGKSEEHSENEGGYLARQMEAVFGAVVEEEALESEIRGNMIKQLTGQKGNKESSGEANEGIDEEGKEHVLDIF